MTGRPSEAPERAADEAPPMQNHPAVDIATAAAAVVVQDRDVVGLDPLLLDALVSTVRAGVRLQLVTPASARLTLPLGRMLRDMGGQWVVRRPDGGYLDGMDGRVLSWDGSSFTEPSGGPAIDERWATPPSAESGSLSVELSTLHPATRELQLGEAIETCCAVLADSGPYGWGVAEPVSQRWDRQDVTTLCRDRAPGASRLVVVGGCVDRPAVGTLAVTPTTSGIREQLWLQVGGGPQVEFGRLDALAGRLADQTVPPRTVLLGLEPGRGDGTVEPVAVGATVPYGLLLGPAVVAELGQERALAAPGVHVRLVGPVTGPSVWVQLLAADSTADPAGVLARVLPHLGVPDLWS